jgi:ribA/ribD-fused uncharacterized protein
MEPMDKPYMHESDGVMIEYPTVEHFFQGMKIVDGTERKAFVDAYSNPFAIKRAAKTLELREDWDAIRDSVMYTALKWKFRKGTMWADTLISTYEMDLVEWNNWHDNYWGWCICTYCQKSVLAPKNKLGKMLMDIREEILSTMEEI